MNSARRSPVNSRPSPDFGHPAKRRDAHFGRVVQICHPGDVGIRPQRGNEVAEVLAVSANLLDRMESRIVAVPVISTSAGSSRRDRLCSTASARRPRTMPRQSQGDGQLGSHQAGDCSAADGAPARLRPRQGQPPPGRVASTGMLRSHERLSLGRRPPRMDVEHLLEDQLSHAAARQQLRPSWQPNAGPAPRTGSHAAKSRAGRGISRDKSV